ncbi:MAG: hypothetical protein FK732_06455, partial [Asgard group archaeon]|nr:hypothetical protein [Asgard group archaeon]
HEVHVFLSGKQPPKYAYELADRVFYKPGPFDIYQDNKVLFQKSLQANFNRLPDYNKARKEIMELDYKERYDAFICDFEQTTSIAGRRLNKPVIVIDRQHAIFHSFCADKVPCGRYEKFAFRLAHIMMVPHFDLCFALDFVNSSHTKDDIIIFPLIKKPEFDNLDVTYDNHIVAYLGRYDQHYVVDILSKFPDETFHLYGFNKEKQIDNIIFKKTSREGFIKDLVSCKAIIGNSGFNLAWEASLLNKLVWTIPHWKILEQVTNAYSLHELGLGYVSEKLTEQDFEKFRDWAEELKYKPNCKLRALPASDLLTNVYDFLEEYQAENYLNKRQIKRSIKHDLSRWRMRKEIKDEVRAKIEI